MKNNDTKKKPREKSKTRAWEKDRRDRVSDCFDKLREVLPNYDPSKKVSRIDVLIVAASTIKDLDEKLKNLIGSSECGKCEDGKVKVSNDIIKKLEDRIKKLLVRNEELANLLKNAGIRVPSAFGYVKKFRRTYKLSSRITQDQAEILQKELEKENQIRPPKLSKPKKIKRNTEIKCKRILSNPKSNRALKRQLANLVPSSNCILIVSQPQLINNSCYAVLSRGPRKINQTVISTSLLLKAPIVSSTVRPSILSTNPPLSDLRPGTLVFANGTVTPIIPTPPPLPALPTIFTNPVQANLPTFVVVSSDIKTFPTNKISISNGSKVTKNNAAGSGECMLSVAASLKRPVVGLNSRPILKPKTCITRTTQVNKVPIPALSSKYNKHLCLDNLKPENNHKNRNIKKQATKYKQCNKRKNQEPQKESKKYKINLKENNNIENLTSNSDIKIKEQSVSSSDVQVSLSSKPEESATGITKEETNEKSNESMKNNRALTDNINLSVLTGEKDSPDSASESKKTTTISAENEPSICNNESSIAVAIGSVSLDNACQNLSEVEKSEKNVTVEISKIGKNDKNNSKIVEGQLQTTISQNSIIVNKPDSELIKPDNSSVTTNCLKQDLRTFGNTISHTESAPKNNDTNDLKALEINLPQSELSNDIFASFQVPPGCQNPGSTSPTAAFLLAFPLVSSGIKVTEVIGDENSESHAGTPNLLQIGTIEISKPTQSYSDSLTPSILNFENFSFFNNKDTCSGFYNNTAIISTSCSTSTIATIASSSEANSSSNKHIGAPLQNFINCNDQNIHSRLDASDNLKFLSHNKTENISIKTSNQNSYKSDNADKISANIKSNNNSHQHPLRAPKDLEAESFSGSYNFNRSSDMGNLTGNLDLNTNSFPPKGGIHDNYDNKTKSNVSGQAFPTKSAESCDNYRGYRDCNLFLTSSVVLNKNYNSVYTSAANNDYFYNASGSSSDNRRINQSACSHYSDYKKAENYNSYTGSSNVYHKEKFNHTMQTKVKPSSQNKPINWMTSPSTTVSYKPDYFLPPFSKEHNFNTPVSTSTTFSTLPSNAYFNTSSSYNPNDHLSSTSEIRKTADLPLPVYNSYQRTETEENQFSWSPNKMPQFLESAHSHTFISSTLPTLVGDLALNNGPALEQKNTKDKNRINQRKVENCENQGAQTNFLSVSQLVEHNQERASAKVISRRSSGNRSKTNNPKSKRVVNRIDVNKDLPNFQKVDKVNQQKHYDMSGTTNLFTESKQQPRNSKTVPSSYSAEALIGNQLAADSSAKKNISNHNKSIVPNFLGDNIVSYFPAVEASQENGYMQANQTFQANSFSQNFTTFQNNTYSSNNFIPSACTLTSTYIPNNNFMHNSNAQDFFGDNTNIFQNGSNLQIKDKNNCMKTYYRQPDKNDRNPNYNCKKAKKRNANESTLPSFDIPFLSMPGTINSPILPDDFHTTYLPPTTLYSCKNPLYPKSNPEVTPNTFIPPLPAITGSKPGMQHSEMSLSVNSVGTSLTNFNLSTIFPEINKMPLHDNFSDSRTKEYHPVSKSFPASSSLQVPFNSKPSIPFGSFGT